ncbi:MAG: HVO_0649 family zinc finger protein [Haloplanus sp.]
MSSAHRTGSSAFDRLRSHYDESSRICPKCGYEDTDGGWRVTTTGSRVHYRHLCPSCGATATRELRL